MSLVPCLCRKHFPERRRSSFFDKDQQYLFLSWSLHTSMRHLAALVYLRFGVKLHLTHARTNTHTHTQCVDRKIILICSISLFVCKFKFSIFTFFSFDNLNCKHINIFVRKITKIADDPAMGFFKEQMRRGMKDMNQPIRIWSPD